MRKIKALMFTVITDVSRNFTVDGNNFANFALECNRSKVFSNLFSPLFEIEPILPRLS